MLKIWDELPNELKNDNVREYYDILYRRRFSLFAKRIFDVTVGLITLIILSPVFIVVSIIIKADSKGPVMFRQIRVTQYGKRFMIFKFRTMANNADKVGAQVTTKNDNRVTKVGRFLRRTRLDEIPQLINIIAGEMSFVGTRPEVIKYVERYTEEMKATFLLPAGVTSEASIQYKDEEQLLAAAENADEIYINIILPEKMKHNLKSLKHFSFILDIKTMFYTLVAVLSKK